MSEPTEALIRKEIQRARKILREDLLLGKLGKAFPDEPPGNPNPPGGPPAPPPVPPKDPPAAKKGLWWGETKE
jgi:hypothetical protein